MVTREAPHDGHGDAAAYVLGALDRPGRTQFEAHLADCEVCRQEFESLLPVADQLALSAPQVDPPFALRSQLLARARQMTLPLPFSARARSSDDRPNAGAAPTFRHRWQRLERFSGALAAVSLVIALFSSAFALSTRQQLQQTSLAAAALGETLSIMYQPGMVARTLSGTDAAPRARGKIFMVPDGKRAVIMTYDLPRLKQGELYQCWLTNDEERRADGGTFTVDDLGRGQRILVTREELIRYRTLGVTREPASGSPGPTGPRVLGGQL
jgi:anti-sigma-K factor RskA